MPDGLSNDHPPIPHRDPFAVRVKTTNPKEGNMPCNLMLHAGAAAVPRTTLRSVATPESTSTWQPIPHEDFVAQVEDLLPRYDLRVVNEAHALTYDDARYFGLLEVRNGSNHRDYSWVLGLRNSHDKSIPAGLVAGSQVFVCDNLVRREA